jgi:hypothetical protein
MRNPALAPSFRGWPDYLGCVGTLQVARSRVLPNLCVTEVLPIPSAIGLLAGESAPATPARCPIGAGSVWSMLRLP